jgi:hypothetical protein
MCQHRAQDTPGYPEQGEAEDSETQHHPKSRLMAPQLEESEDQTAG